METERNCVLKGRNFSDLISSNKAVGSSKKMCILMFSGGRDSTLSAIRLSEQYDHIVLVTVTSNHLCGVVHVKERLRELKRKLMCSADWLLVRQPENLNVNTSFYAPTCLPCHHAYIAVGVCVANTLGAKYIAFGYVGYQQHWPEQTANATTRLKYILEKFTLKLLLPVYEIERKDEAINMLEGYGLTSISLEQKCTQQINNIELEPEQLASELAEWESAIVRTLEMLSNQTCEVIERVSLTNIG